MYLGWHHLGFTRDLTGDLTPNSIAQLPLVVVQRPKGIVAYNAICPHRGANLAYGGRLDDDVIVCPFHGRRIRLGAEDHNHSCVTGYPTVEVGGSLFVLLSKAHECGYATYLQSLARTHAFVPGFMLTIRVEPEYVIENVFDTHHFKEVHGINSRPHLDMSAGDDGELIVQGVFRTNRPNPWQKQTATEGIVETRFCARVFSPTLVATELGPEGQANVVITGATPMPDGSCSIRTSFALALDSNRNLPSREVAQYLMRDSRTAFEQDMAIWEHMVTDMIPDYDESDRLVLAYREFCQRFLANAPA